MRLGTSRSGLFAWVRAMDWQLLVLRRWCFVASSVVLDTSKSEAVPCYVGLMSQEAQTDSTHIYDNICIYGLVEWIIYIRVQHIQTYHMWIDHIYIYIYIYAWRYHHIIFIYLSIKHEDIGWCNWISGCGSIPGSDLGAGWGWGGALCF